MTRKTHRTVRLALTVAGASIALLLTMGFTPATNAAAVSAADSFSSKLAPVSTTTVLVADSGSAAFSTTSAHVRSLTTIPTRRAATFSSSRSSSSSGSSSTAARSGTASGSESAQAKAILANYIAKYPVLQGATVSFGDAKGYQAICYYRSGRIVISPTHTASLERIIRHEVGHIIDWRDNGVINWGENIPAL